MENTLNVTSYGLLTWQLLILTSIILWVYSLIDLLNNSFEKNDKIVWVLIVLLVPIVGSILYIYIGSKQKLNIN